MLEPGFCKILNTKAKTLAGEMVQSSGRTDRTKKKPKREGEAQVGFCGHRFSSQRGWPRIVNSTQVFMAKLFVMLCRKEEKHQDKNKKSKFERCAFIHMGDFSP
ncbi:Uncharacterized protein TCM_016394 [Theobroma cacao]|uniref:Uncharacterized protein n=1 Tax=Theobroma cacao TaxID=3641 RepID=A0A061G4Z1_THECC|nr:Uncharacterized protein TCM_016394 [Theobroma cacao]